MEKTEIVQIKTREIFHLLLIKDADIVLAHRLFSQIYDVVRDRQQVQCAMTPETTSLARWSLEESRKELDETLLELNLCDLDKTLVRYVADHYELY